MSERYKVLDDSVPTFITCTLVDWVDLFIRPVYYEILDDAFNYCIQNKGLKVHAYVYMTSHIHFIATSNDEPLAGIIRAFKSFTAKQFIKAIKEQPESRREWLLNKFSYAANRIKRGKSYKVWKDGFHPVILDSGYKIEQRIRYIHDNPVESGFVHHARDWKNSSYLRYEDSKSLPSVNLTPLF